MCNECNKQNHERASESCSKAPTESVIAKYLNTTGDQPFTDGWVDDEFRAIARNFYAKFQKVACAIDVIDLIEDKSLDISQIKQT